MEIVIAKTEIIRLHEEIEVDKNKIIEKVIRLGELLTTLKEELPHGSFTNWIKENCQFTERTARNYMRAYQRRDELKTEMVSLLQAYKGTEKLKVLPEFRDALPPKRNFEKLQLERSIIQEGIRHPIITWNGFLVDGHARYEIALKHGLPFETKEMPFESIEEGVAFIIDSQLAYKNLDLYQMITLTEMWEQLVFQQRSEKGEDWFAAEMQLIEIQKKELAG